jgi:hypothetical protein
MKPDSISRLNVDGREAPEKVTNRRNTDESEQNLSFLRTHRSGKMAAGFCRFAMNDCLGLKFSEAKENLFTARSLQNDSDDQIIRWSRPDIHSRFLTWHILQEMPSSQFSRYSSID